MNNKILKTALENAVTKRIDRKFAILYFINLKNVKTHYSETIGCHGFIKAYHDQNTSVMVYVNTENTHYPYVRYVKDEKDFTGCVNEKPKECTKDSLADLIAEMLMNKERYEKELRIWKKK